MKLQLLAACLFVSIFTIAQKTPDAKFGSVSAADLSRKTYELDTSAGAVVLYDIGSTQIVGNKKGWFSLEFKRKKRIHILHKSEYDRATIEIPLYTSGEYEEELSDIKAATYNLEGGKVVDAKLEKGSIFKDRKNKNLVVKKFTFPAVREGSIIEYEYKIVSDFLFNLQPWTFQSDVPHLWSEYRVVLPQFLGYVLVAQGDGVYTIYERKDGVTNYSVSSTRAVALSNVDDLITISCGKSDFRWAIQDIKALKPEIYTSSVGNYAKKLEFQLAELSDPLVPEKIMTNWPDAASKLLKREDFGGQIEIRGAWAPALLTPLIAGRNSDLQRAKAIYEYVRNNYTCTDYYALYLERPLKEVAKNKNGSVAEINLLLIALLREAGMRCDPIILSTRENGFVSATYPIISKFNYVIASVEIDGARVLLDASHPLLGFGKLKDNLYNGRARMINEAATEIRLSADDILEKETTVVKLVKESDQWKAEIKQLKGYYESIASRQEIKEKGQDVFFSQLAKNFPNETKITETTIDSLNDYEQPVQLRYSLRFPAESADIIYVSPVLVGAYKHNPFKAANRVFPVEIPYVINEEYTLSLAIPEGYRVDEIPKSLTVQMQNPGDGSFEYKITQGTNIITLKFKLELNRAKFKAKEYDELREFFNLVSAKQSEQIVFKKK